MNFAEILAICLFIPSTNIYWMNPLMPGTVLGLGTEIDTESILLSPAFHLWALSWLSSPWSVSVIPALSTMPGRRNPYHPGKKTD